MVKIESENPEPEKSADFESFPLPSPPKVMPKDVSQPPHGVALFPVARPTKFNWIFARDLCIRIQNGEYLTDICKDESQPSYSSIANWMEKYPKFCQWVERSRKMAADAIAEKSMTMFDDEPPMETIQTKNGSIERISMSGVQRERYKSQAMQWYASKWNPDKYGDKLSVQNTFDITAVLNSVNTAQATKIMKKAQKAIEISPAETTQAKQTTSEEIIKTELA